MTAVPTPPLEIPGYLLTAGEHAAGSELPWHEHPGATICLALRGAFHEYTRGRTLTCRPRTIKVTPAGERHRNRFDLGPTRGLLIEVRALPAEAARPFARALDEPRSFDGGSQTAAALRVYGEFARRDDLTPVVVEGLLIELLAAIARQRAPAAARAPWLVRARDMVHDSFGGALTLGEVAAAVGVHQVTLARAFRTAYGCTFGEYLRRTRVDAAARSLSTTDRPLSIIALDTGFADQSHFSNVFRRYTGVTPGAYRRMARGGM
ncbi:MAG TPA: helix-turn-helix transcriptional regulator [Gemmatimonadales bacterium]